MLQKEERYRLTKAERITSEKEIEILFNQGKRKHFGTLALTWLIGSSDTEALPKILASAPKKQFSKASDRNRIKRLIREAYRLLKGPLMRLAAEKRLNIQMAVIYTGRDLPDYHQVEQDMKEVIAWMLQRIAD